MRERNDEKGAIMVETTMIFPIVMLTVVALLYLGLFKMEETAMLYQVQRVAQQGSLMAASPGYASLAQNGALLDAREIDWEVLPAADIDDYYRAYYENGDLFNRLMVLYREIFGCSWISDANVESYGGKVLDTVSVLAVGDFVQREVKLERDWLGTKVYVRVYYGVETPAVLRYFDLPERLEWEQAAYSRAVNPAGFVRNTDLAADAMVALSEKLGLNGELEKIQEAFSKLKGFLF